MEFAGNVVSILIQYHFAGRKCTHKTNLHGLSVLLLLEQRNLDNRTKRRRLRISTGEVVKALLLQAH